MKKIVNLVLVLIVIGLIAAVIGLSVNLSRSAGTSIGNSAYSIGAIDEKGRVVEDDGSIYTRKGISVSDVDITIKKDADITYKLFFYDKSDDFISSTDYLTTDFDGTIPEKAKTFKVMITPTDDDGKVSFFEKGDYAKQLRIVIEK